MTEEERLAEQLAEERRVVAALRLICLAWGSDPVVLEEAMAEARVVSTTVSKRDVEEHTMRTMGLTRKEAQEYLWKQKRG